MPESEINGLRNSTFSTLDWLGTHGVAYCNYTIVREFNRDGKRRAWLWFRDACGWIIETALTTRLPPELAAIPPEQAWLYARSQDSLSPQPIPFEGEPPAGMSDPAPPTHT